RYWSVATVTTAGILHSSVRNWWAPSTIQRRMPDASPFNLVGRSRSGSTMVVSQGTSRTRRQIPWSVPVIVGRWLLNTTRVWDGVDGFGGDAGCAGSAADLEVAADVGVGLPRFEAGLPDRRGGVGVVVDGALHGE